jgi:hypothetical protein
MKQENLWKKWLLIIIWIAILLLGLFLYLKLNWAKDTAIEKWNNIKESVNQWSITIKNADWLDENAETKTYSIFHESTDDDEDKYKDLEYNFDDYYDYNTENNNDHNNEEEDYYDYNF